MPPSTPTSVNTPTPVPPPNPAAIAQNPVANANAITPTSNGTAATIPAAAITTNSKLTLPDTSTSSGTGPANAIMGYAQGLSAPQSALLSASDATQKTATDRYNSAQSGVTGLINTYLGEGQDQLDQENAAGVPGLRSNAASLATQLNTQQLAYNTQYNAILNNPGATMEQKAQQISSLQQQHGYDLSDTSIRTALANTDYTNAENIIQHNIDIKYAPLKDAITYQEQVLSNNKDLLTTAQNNSFSANLAVQQQMYTQGTFYQQLNATTGLDMVKTAAANGADPATLSAMSAAVASGASFADVAAASNGTLKTGNYAVAYNPTTQQMGIFNANTGKFADGSSGSPNTTINGTDTNAVNTVTAGDGSAYNFAASGYNTADPNYGLKMTAATTSITQQFGTIATPQIAQAVLDQQAPTAPFNGQMVINAAQSAGVDPTVFMAQLKNESLYGTSNVAQKDNNYGGIKYVGQQNATQGTAAPEGGFYAHFNTPQDGLNAQAALVAKAKQAPPPNATGTTASIQQNLQTITDIKHSLPSNISSAISYMGSTGDGYLDTSKVVDLPGAPAGTALNQAVAYAKQYGLTVLTGSQASAMQDADTALTQINNIQTAWNAVAPSTNAPNLSGIPNSVGLMLHTPNSVGLKTYLGMVPTAISTLNAITGSKRLSAFSSDISLDALPVIATFGANLGGQPADTLEEGNAKLDDLRKDINASITPIINNSKGAPLSGEMPTNTVQPYAVNGTTYTQGVDGLYYPSPNGATLTQ